MTAMTERLFNRFYRNAETGGGTGAPAAGTDATPGAGEGSPAAGGVVRQPADGGAKKEGEGSKPAELNPAAKAANDALAAAGDKKPNDDTAKGDDKSKGENADDKKDGENKSDEKKDGEAEVNFDAEPAEIYKDLKYPEGFEVQPELIQPVLDMFKGEKISPQLAQKIVDKHLEVVAASEGQWMQEINTQWDKFTQDAEFYKDNKITPEAEKAYGRYAAHDADMASFLQFLQKNGGMFHPGFAKTVKLINKGLPEGDIKDGKNPPKEKGAKSFYSKSNHKND